MWKSAYGGGKVTLRYARATLGVPTLLFPVTHGSKGEAKAESEGLLAHAGSLADGLHDLLQLCPFLR